MPECVECGVSLPLPDGGRCPENPDRALPRPRRERGRDAVWDFLNAPSVVNVTLGSDDVHGIQIA